MPCCTLLIPAASTLRAVPASAQPHAAAATACTCTSPPPPVPARAHALRGCLRRAQNGRMPLHIAAMQQGGEAEAVVALLLEAYPAGAKEKDNVRCRNPDLPSVCELTHRSLRVASPPLLRYLLSTTHHRTHPPPHCRTASYPWIWPCSAEALVGSSLCWSRVRPLGSLMSISSASRWLAQVKSRSSSLSRTISTQTRGGSSASSACTPS